MEDISAILHNKLTQFRQNPLHFLESVVRIHIDKETYQKYVDELKESRLIGEKKASEDKTVYVHGTDAWLACEEKMALKKKLVSDQIINFIAKNPGQASIDILLLLKRS